MKIKLYKVNKKLLTLYNILMHCTQPIFNIYLLLILIIICYTKIIKINNFAIMTSIFNFSHFLYLFIYSMFGKKSLIFPKKFLVFNNILSFNLCLRPLVKLIFFVLQLLLLVNNCPFLFLILFLLYAILPIKNSIIVP